MPNFEVLDARVASALNKIIHNSHFERKISLEEQKAQKDDRFLRGRQIACLDLLHRPVHHCFFEMTIFRNSILSGTEYCCL